MYSQRHNFFFRRKIEALETREGLINEVSKNGQRKCNPALLQGLLLLERLIEFLEF
jgi:hypothetical protein